MEQIQYEELKKLQKVHWWYSGKREILTKVIEHLLGKDRECLSVLDVGCGMGLMLDALKEELGFGQVFGCDMEDVAVEYCKRNYPKTEIVKGYLPDGMDFDEDTFDLIVASDVLEHVKDDNAALCTLGKLVKKNGYIVLTVPALMSMWSYNDELNHHWRRYDAEELEKKIEQNIPESEIVYFSYYNSKLFVPAYIIRWVKKKLDIETSDVKSIGKDTLFNRILKKIFVSEYKTIICGKKFRKGVSLIAVVKNKG